MLSVVLYGCETWCLTLREEHRLRLFEKRMLWRIFGPQRDEVTRRWRKVHDEELLDLNSSLRIIIMIWFRIMRLAEDVAHIEKRSAYRLLM
jgi:hypothetical protein